MLLLSLVALALSPDPVCTPQRPMSQVAARASKYDSTMATIGAAQVKICYSRPMVNGRTIFGSALVPYGKLWRTGANEPTILHTTAPIMLAGLRLEAGSYSLYTVPQSDAPWEIVVNRSITQWGHEGSYDAVRGQELGRSTAPSSHTEKPVESFTINLSPTAILLSWERTQVTIPVGSVK